MSWPTMNDHLARLRDAERQLAELERAPLMCRQRSFMGPGHDLDLMRQDEARRTAAIQAAAARVAAAAARLNAYCTSVRFRA